jgi:FHS family L-fucose permease-like MFS transporter
MQSTFVDTAIYFAYFITALPAGWVLKQYGYKKGIITGLIVFSAGCFLFIPAALTRTYGLFLTGLFIIGCGLTMLETAANPYAAQLGDEETATSRLNLAQSFNGLAVFIAPLIGTFFILSGTSFSNEELTAMTETSRNTYLDQEAGSVILPYAFLGGFLLIIAIIFLLYKFPFFLVLVNTNNYLLGCNNYVVDFKGREHRRGRHDDYISLSTKIDYKPISEYRRQCPEVIEEINKDLNEILINI